MSIVSVSRCAGPPQRRARDVHPVLGLRERRLALRLEVLDVGQQHGQLVVRHRDDPADVAVDDRDRAAPVALPREAPVPQPEVDGEPAASLGLEPLDDPAAALGRRQPVELAGVDECLVLGVRDVRPSSASASPSAAGPRAGSGGRTRVAKSKSRWSCAGTAMTAPVP